MGKIAAVVGGLSIGAAAMYLWDPKKGHARRVELQQKLNSVWKAKLQAKEVMLRDARNRLKGLSAAATARFRKPSYNDEQLITRIRSEIGHVISHPKAIKVQASEGTVRLSGPIFANEVEDIIRETWNVPGVASIEHQFDVHTPGDNLPELQGEYKPRDRRMDILREDWKPATSLAVGLAGGMLAIYGLSKRGVSGTAMGAFGLGLLAKSLRDSEGRFIMNQVLD